MSTKLIKQIKKALTPALVGAGATEAATLVRETPGARTPGNYAGGRNPVVTSIPCKGFVSSEKHDKIGDTVVDQTHRIVCLVGLDVVPTSNDRITIDGATMPIVDLQGNAAIWTCLCRR